MAAKKARKRGGLRKRGDQEIRMEIQERETEKYLGKGSDIPRLKSPAERKTLGMCVECLTAKYELI